jgi:hypothetical protein
MVIPQMQDDQRKPLLMGVPVRNLITVQLQEDTMTALPAAAHAPLIGSDRPAFRQRFPRGELVNSQEP